MFYKVVMGDDIVDVMDGLQYCKYSSRAHMVLRCSEKDKPEGVISERLGAIYRVEGWTPPIDDTVYEGVVDIIPIDEDTYKEIAEALDSGDVPMDSSLYEQAEQDDETEQKLTAAQILQKRLNAVEDENAQLKEDLQKTQDMLKELYEMVNGKQA